jgi:hypothetical protein
MDFDSSDSSWDSDYSASEDEALQLMLLEDQMSDSDESEEIVIRTRSANVDRRRQLYHRLLFEDYWGPNPVYSNEAFRRRFRMPIGLFNEIVERIQQTDSYFVQKRDVCKLLGFSALQKVAAAIQMLATGIAADMQDDKYRMAETTGLENLKRFCLAIDAAYGQEALRKPTAEDLQQILERSDSDGWPGCIGSIDCMHWAWKNCPSSWKGMFKGKEDGATVVLEAIADHSCRFWHFFFGMPGSLNDINVLDRSPLHHDAINGKSPAVSYKVNGNTYDVPYWLADGIYPNHHCFVKSSPNSASRKHQLFSAEQEKKRKDVERAFGILQARFHVLTVPCRLWSRDAMRSVIKCCVILHNMIIDYEKKNNQESAYIQDRSYRPSEPFTVTSRNASLPLTTAEKVIAFTQIKNTNLHHRLREDLANHQWALHGAKE